MRIVATRRTALLFPQSVSVREQAPVHTRSETASGLPTRLPPTVCFSEPEGALSTSASWRGTGTDRARASIPRTAPKGDEPFEAFTFDPRLAECVLVDEPCSGTEAGGRKGSRRLSTSESPSRTDSAHLVRREQEAGETERLSYRMLAGAFVLSGLARGRALLRPQVPASVPRRAPLSRRGRRCVPFVVPFGRARFRVRSRELSFPRGTCVPRNADALQSFSAREPSTFFTARDAQL